MKALALILALLATPATAGSFRVRGIDIGGVIVPRAIRIMEMRAQGRRVEITGPLCLSSCTMYLGAGNVCVSPDTVFGFHGPTYYGVPLSDARFEYWSDLISSHYKAPLKRWYMQTARYKTRPIRLTGAKLIELGYEECEQ